MNAPPRQPRKAPASASNAIVVLWGAFLVLALVFVLLTAWTG